MKFLCVGDVHGRFADLLYLHKHVEHDHMLQIGDLDGEDSDRELLRKAGKTIFYIYGNHDNYSENSEKSPVTLIKPSRRFSENGSSTQEQGCSTPIGSVTVAGLSGIYSPKRFGFPKENPKYFSYEDLIVLARVPNVDILMSHEPFRGMGMSPRFRHQDTGIRQITTLVDFLKPKIFLSGHYHYPKIGVYKDTIYLSIPYVNAGYGIVEIVNGEVANAVLFQDPPTGFVSTTTPHPEDDND